MWQSVKEALKNGSVKNESLAPVTTGEVKAVANSNDTQFLLFQLLILSMLIKLAERSMSYYQMQSKTNWAIRLRLLRKKLHLQKTQ